MRLDGRILPMLVMALMAIAGASAQTAQDNSALEPGIMTEARAAARDWPAAAQVALQGMIGRSEESPWAYMAQAGADWRSAFDMARTLPAGSDSGTYSTGIKRAIEQQAIAYLAMGIGSGAFSFDDLLYYLRRADVPVAGLDWFAIGSGAPAQILAHLRQEQDATGTYPLEDAAAALEALCMPRQVESPERTLIKNEFLVAASAPIGRPLHLDKWVYAIPANCFSADQRPALAVAVQNILEWVLAAPEASLDVYNISPGFAAHELRYSAAWNLLRTLRPLDPAAADALAPRVDSAQAPRARVTPPPHAASVDRAMAERDPRLRFEMLYDLADRAAPGVAYEGRPADVAAALDAANSTLAAYDSLWSTELPRIADLGRIAGLIGRSEQAQDLAAKALDHAVAVLEDQESSYRALSGDDARTAYLAAHLRQPTSYLSSDADPLRAISIVGDYALQPALARVRAMHSSLKPAALVWLGGASLGRDGD